MTAHIFQMGHHPRDPNTSSEGVLGIFQGSKYLLRWVFGCLGPARNMLQESIWRDSKTWETATILWGFDDGIIGKMDENGG